ncbi:hypothetical protein Naga_100919g2 [Nannochloropsis gaditana]|uniref:Uncharacterized protein n=1 Tax=Nannochloropsis gaditana TaxID=72520 RepID=W7TS40_9STRA|nr:hypothetical protein Naga_100919g2 [Nannochloropsis gaditana]
MSCFVKPFLIGLSHFHPQAHVSANPLTDTRCKRSECLEGGKNWRRRRFLSTERGTMSVPKNKEDPRFMTTALGSIRTRSPFLFAGRR